jgi:UDP-N-acetyl-D-glucosamine/UDP-N-acetyl-D-galactosamine dehydrogenase
VPFVNLLIKETPINGDRELSLGITFIKNCLPTGAFAKYCPNIRNTKAIDIYHELVEYGMEVDVYDPWASPEEVMHEYGITSTRVAPELPSLGGAGGGRGLGVVILAVAHNQFLSLDLKSHKNYGTVIYDVKGILDNSLVDGKL